MGTTAYEDRLRNEVNTFADQVDLHERLPPAFHHWSARHVGPKLAALGFPTMDDFFVDPIVRQARETDEVTVLSLGSGNGEQEFGWLTKAAERGATNVRLRLLEMNPVMQRRAAALAARLGLADRVEHLERDFNTWTADRAHDVVFANQALHHVVELEHLYREIHTALGADGVLVVSDMIGRNGHRRWPEALEVVERLWATLPAHLRRNSITGKVDETYPDEDYASVGFEGVRAQDVLPLLLDVFHPEVFFGFGNVADPFLDRVYGENFDLDEPEHLAFVEQLGVLDDALLDTGLVKPTHLLGTFRTRPTPLRCHGTRTPRSCVRDTGPIDLAGRVSFDPAAVDQHGIVCGNALVAGRINGVHHDGWAGEHVDVPLFTTAPAHVLRVQLYVPDHLSPGTLTVRIDGVEIGAVTVGNGLGSYLVPLGLPARRHVSLRLEADWFDVPADTVRGGDKRRLSHVLRAVELGDASLLTAGTGSGGRGGRDAKGSDRAGG